MANKTYKITAGNGKLILLVFICLIMIIPVSCSKYQDGPLISFRKKEKRLAGTWKHSAFIYINQNLTVTTNLPETKYTYTEDGKYYTSVGDTGTWEFGSGVDLNITFKVNGNDSLRTFEILRLAKKDLWLKTGDEEWHFEPE